MQHKNLTPQDSHSPSQERIENNTGVAIPALRCIKYTQVGTLYADAIVASPGDDVRGITVGIIQDTENGYILAYGPLYNINTSAWTAGNSLYCDVGGVLTNVSNGSIQVGNVLKQHATQGIIQITCLDTPATSSTGIQDTDSIDMDNVGPYIKSDLKLSSDAATAGSIKATATIKSGAGAGLHIEYPTAAPITQTPDQANATGVSTNLARSDHIHNIPADAPTTTLSPSTSNAEGVGSSFARADHTHAIAVSGSGVIANILPDDTAFGGAANSFARGDHVHAISTDAPSTTLSPATTNSEGVGGSFARADHTHGVVTALTADITTLQPDDAAAAGTANTFARGDHKHAIVAASASGQTPDQANAEGVSTSFARADHVHNIPTAAPTTNLTPATTNTQGAAATFARSDHSHAITSGTPTDISTNANAAGSAASFAKSDHTHQLTSVAATADQIPQFNGTNWIATNPEVALDPSKVWWLYDEFMAGNNGGASGSIGGDCDWLFTKSGAGGTGDSNSAKTDTNHPGVLKLQSGNGGSNYSDMLLGYVQLGGGIIETEFLVQVETLSTVSNEYSIRIGLGDTAGADQTNGVYFEYTRTTSTNWLIKTASAATRTSTTTSTAVTAGSWVKLRISINAAASSVTFYINGVSVGTITTNIPTTVISYRMMQTRTAGTPVGFDIDYFKTYQRLTTSR